MVQMALFLWRELPVWWGIGLSALFTLIALWKFERTGL